MSAAVAARRPMLRSSAFRAAARFESTTTQKAAETAKEKASDATSKASQGLSRVTSSAGPAIAGAAKGLGNALGKVGGRTGRLISFAESTCWQQKMPDALSMPPQKTTWLTCVYRASPHRRLLL